MHGNERKPFRFCIFPGYNWCGPGCNGPGPPINEVDAACKAHDICYRKFGNRYECDRELLWRLQPHLESRTELGRHARILYRYMKVQAFFRCG